MKDEQQPDVAEERLNVIAYEAAWDATMVGLHGAREADSVPNVLRPFIRRAIDTALTEAVQGYERERDHLAEQLGLVYDHVTDGKLSKPYDFKAVESQIDDCITEHVQRAAAERVAAAEHREQALRDAINDNLRPPEHPSDDVGELVSAVEFARAHMDVQERSVNAGVDARAGLEAQLQALRDGLREASEPLRLYVERERDIRNSINKGGQHVGYTPRVTPSVLKELERLLAPIDALLTAPGGPQEPKSPIEQLAELLDQAGATIRYGLRQQGHIPTVERMRAEGKSWDEIGVAIGWTGHAVERWYAMESAGAATPGQEPKA